MSISRLLLSLPLKRQTVVGVLLLVTVFFIVYQFTFVAELGKTDSSQQESKGRHAPNLDASNRKHPRDVNLGGERKKVIKNTDDSGKIEKQGYSNGGGAVNNTSKLASLNAIQNLNQAKVKQNVSFTFKCETSGREISVNKINDNFCDCPEDGSDEPRTNACANGKFSCLKYITPFPESIPSGWVNDGVCDCCDGSDEWKGRKNVAELTVSLQKKIGRYLSPCPNQCPDAV